MYISFLRGAKRLFIALVNWPIKCANIPLLKLKGEPVVVCSSGELFSNFFIMQIWPSLIFFAPPILR